MKKILFLTILLLSTYLISFGQKKSNKQKEAEEALRQEIWSWDDPAFKATEIPEKWKNESAVILAKANKYEYKETKKGSVYIPIFFSTSNEFYEKVAIRRRIKLLDKAAVNTYSEFSFLNEDNKRYWKSESTVALGIRVIKPNGTVKDVALEEAVVQEIKTKYAKAEIKKVAVPDLEVGDIIDYFSAVVNPINGGISYLFDPIFYLLQEEYAIAYQNLEIGIMKNCGVMLSSVNGAPQLKETPTEEGTIYSLIEKDTEKMQTSRWVYPLRVLPLIKFRADYSEDNDSNPDFKKVEKLSEKSTRVIAYNKLHTPTQRYMTKGGYQKRFMEKGYYDSVFYKYRNPTYYLGGLYYGNSLEYALINMHKPRVYLSKFSIPSMKDYFADVNPIVARLNFDINEYRLDIDYDILLFAPRQVSSLDKALFGDEFEYAFRINQPEESYIFATNNNANFKEIPTHYEGVEAYIVKGSLKFDEVKLLGKIKIPVSSHQDNATTQNIDLKIEDEKVVMTRQTTAKGANRHGYNPSVLTWYDFVYEERERKKVQPLEETVKKKEKEEVLAKIVAEKEKENKEREDALKKSFEGEYPDFKLLSLDNFKLEQMGMHHTQPELIFSETYTLEGLVKKVGNNYTIDAGKLIGAQVDLDEKEIKERKYDVYFDYARSFNENITINVPDGYEVQGLDKFSYNVENETGGFVSTAKLEGNKVIITTSKYYKNNFEPAANWSKIVDFVEAAFQFTQQKLLLKKK
jgi:hypothetical protein